MGLAAPRKRIKISHDPNNLAWSQSTESYGQKILSSQGWTPGDFLGARDAKHASHYGKASASHIRVAYKDDNLGLGAQSAGKNAENSRTGFDAFHGLLGRLNGKSEGELEKEQKRSEDITLALYAKGRWGGMEFVRGGILVQGEGFKEGIEEEEATEADEYPGGNEGEEHSHAERRKRKEEKRSRKDARRKQKEASKSVLESPMEVRHDNGPGKAAKGEGRMAEKKEKRKKEKKKKKSARESSQTGTDSDFKADTATVEDMPRAEVKKEASGRQVKDSIAAPAMPSRTGRHVLRGRNIQAKKMAFQDANGLDGIFMRAAQS